MRTSRGACQWADLLRPMISREPSRFWADPQESGFINGHALAVDGGWTADGSWEALRLRHR